MKFGYYAKIIFLFLVTTTIMIGILVVLSFQMQKRIVHAIDHDLENIVHTVHYSTQKVSADKYPDKDSLEKFINAVRKNPTVREVSIVNKDRRIVASSDPSKIGHERQVRRDFMIVNERLGFDSQMVSSRQYKVTIPVLRDNTVAGVVQTSFRFTNIDSMFWNLTVQTSILAAFALMIMVTIFSYFLYRINKPIAQLCKAAERVSTGDMSVRVDERRDDEIGKLVNAFNEMTGQLQQQKTLENRLNLLERQTILSETAAIMAHEVRNPLNLINLTAGHIEHQFSEMVGERRDEFETLIGNLKNQVRHLNLMVEQFLAVGKSRSTVVEKFDLATLVEEVVALVRQQILVKNITLEIRIKSDTTCHGDREQIGLVILNLVLNAVQFSSLGSQIIIEGKGENNNCVVKVRDTGPGIDPAIINKVFEPWVTTREGGVGLGLALCKRVVERHNGTIKAVNNEQGGAIFEFSIPMEF